MAKKMIYCNNGHIYNSKEFENCPFCYGEDANKMVNVTMPAMGGKAVNYKEMEETDRTSAGFDRFYELDESEYTIGKSMKETGMDPVVGQCRQLKKIKKEISLFYKFTIAVF